MNQRISKIISITALFLFIFVFQALAGTSLVEKFSTDEVRGEGPLPYNYRIIDENIHAGGHPLNPKTSFGNTNKEALVILNYLKSKGVRTIIDLENSWWIQWHYKNLLKEAGIKRIHIPMSSSKVPDYEEWQMIKEFLREPVYIHCKWGADRTGAIIARYLVEEKGYAPKEAWEAVITGGTHAGPIGGLKKGSLYKNLVLFFWPEAHEDKEFRECY